MTKINLNIYEPVLLSSKEDRLGIVTKSGETKSFETSQYTDEDLKKACQEFEAIFAEYLLKSMWQTVPDEGFIEKSQAQKIWEEMYVSELAKVSSEGRGLGIKDTLYKQLMAQKTYNNPSK